MLHIITQCGTTHKPSVGVTWHVKEKYPNEYSYQQGLSSGHDNFSDCNDADTWTWGGNCSLAMVPAKETCNTNQSADVWTNNIRNTTACLDDYKDGWKKWYYEDPKSCNDLARQGIILDVVRNQTLVDRETHINETSDNSPRAPRGASEDTITWNWKTMNGISVIKNSTGTYRGGGNSPR
jgi:hypothetical protein